MAVEQRQSWDAIVIGSGLGGLACAAYLCAAGKRTLVLEAHYVAGGNSQVFRRGRPLWGDPAPLSGPSGVGPVQDPAPPGSDQCKARIILNNAVQLGVLKALAPQFEA